MPDPDKPRRTHGNPAASASTGTPKATASRDRSPVAAPRIPHRLSLQVQFDDTVDPADLPASRPQLRRWVQAALEADAELVVRFVGREESRQLNHQYRGKDRPTNVLTFDYAHEPVVQADIVICLPVLQDEAHAQNKPLRNHLAHLVIHGVLHAHGMDHLTDEEAAEMESREIELLHRFRIDDPYRLPDD
jgi:metalloprotein, YbeY family